MKTKSIITSIILSFAMMIANPAWADDLEETVKYKPPTMDQTVGYIQSIMPGFADFDSAECMLTARMIKNRTTFDYHIPLKELDPSPGYVKTRLTCVDLAVPGNKRVIVRVGKDQKEDLRHKVDTCTDNRENAEHLATALRYLIGLCANKPCSNCPPFPWETRQ